MIHSNVLYFSTATAAATATATLDLQTHTHTHTHKHTNKTHTHKRQFEKVSELSSDCMVIVLQNCKNKRVSP